MGEMGRNLFISLPTPPTLQCPHRASSCKFLLVGRHCWFDYEFVLTSPTVPNMSFLSNFGEMGGKWLYSCCFSGAPSKICSKQLIAFLCHSHLAFSQNLSFNIGGTAIRLYRHSTMAYICRVELSSEWSNCVAISVYARLFVWIELSVGVKRKYVNNNNCDY